MQSSVARACALAAAALITLLSCRDSVTEPSGSRTLAELHQLHVTYDFPQLAATSVKFWVVKGKSASAELWYHARPGAIDSARFVEFTLGAGALDRRPDGSTIATGDSVLIELTVTDGRHMMIDFQPTGLRFSAAEQPTFKMFWTGCGDDLNYDGHVDSLDVAIADQLEVWRQEGAAQPWFKLASTVDKGARTVSALLPGFSGYAIMY
jgi:hypothetical protein